MFVALGDCGLGWWVVCLWVAGFGLTSSVVGTVGGFGCDLVSLRVDWFIAVDSLWRFCGFAAWFVSWLWVCGWFALVRVIVGLLVR